MLFSSAKNLRQFLGFLWELFPNVRCVLRQLLPQPQLSKMVLHNPNNWHWVNKDASEWAEEFLSRTLTKISAKDGDVSAKVTKIITMDGDVDVSQRKGKVITLFDVKLQLEYEGGSKGSEHSAGWLIDRWQGTLHRLKM
jgi:Activator of Hsp90 ATPase, N-terminal